VPARYTSDALLAELAARGPIAGTRMLLPRADIAPPALPEGLRSAGADVVEVIAYRTVSETTLPEGLVERLEAGEIHLVTFTSASTVRAFVASLPPDRRARCLMAFEAASIGPETSRALGEATIRIAVEAAESTAAGLVAAVRAWAAGPAGGGDDGRGFQPQE
jgi:uroporphyrinogen III methyltransferase/synthase